MNKARRTRIKPIRDWFTHHVDHDDRFTSIGEFNVQASRAAGLPAVNGLPGATSSQLAQVEEWMTARVHEHCNTHGCTTPRVVRETP